MNSEGNIKRNFIQYVRKSAFISALGVLFFVAVTLGESACARYSSLVNEDPAAKEGEPKEAPKKSEANLQQEILTPPAAWKEIKKVVLIMLENADEQAAMKLPSFEEFSKKGALLNHYFAITHPSQPNYISLISGSTQRVDSDDKVDLPMRHIGDLLDQVSKTWKVYAEDYPGNCFLDSTYKNYVRKHVPFLSFENIQNNKKRCDQVISADSFLNDLKNASLPDFSLYIPNQLNNGHDTGVRYSDRWLGEKMLPHVLEAAASPKNDVLFIVTFDEGEIFGDNKIYTALLGAGVKVGAVSNQAYSHFSLLKTIETILNLPSLGLNDVHAKVIGDIWKAD